MFHSKEFIDPSASDVDAWLNSFDERVEIVGYSAYGVGDNRYRQEFSPGIFVTVKTEASK